jgi:hypothetical protein
VVWALNLSFKLYANDNLRGGGEVVAVVWALDHSFKYTSNYILVLGV